MQPDLDQPEPLGQSLRALPGESQPPYDFLEFQRRAAHLGARADSGGRRWALAACLTIGVLLVVLLLRVGSAPTPWPVSAGGDAPESAALAGSARVEVMEHWLAGFPQDPALVRVGPRAAITDLEDRIAQFDDLLSSARLERQPPRRLELLQQERTRLVGALVQVRYAETLADAAQ